MELRDLIVTPILIILIVVIALAVRPYVTDEINRRYFMPALLAKVSCAIILGLLYQFYYPGGDTYNYHTQGSRLIWDACMQSPTKGMQLIFSGQPSLEGVYKYGSKIIFLHDPSSYFIVRISAFFDLITFSTYSATAVLFSLVSFVGMWMFFLTFYKRFPHLHRWIALAAFFIPSSLFWGSGLLKDTITLACLGIMTFMISEIFIEGRISLKKTILLAIAVIVVYIVKKYILLCFVPAALLWIYSRHFSAIRSTMLKVLLIPLVLFVVIVSGFYAVIKVGEDDPRYAIENLASTARITAYDIGFYTGKDAGSGYSLGELDGTFVGLLKLMPKAINVTIFRPYPWEVRNALMLLSSIESLFFITLTFYVLFVTRFKFFEALAEPNILFCLVFAITFAFAVGVSTFNFGTLMRYKIPMQPFYVIAMVLILDYPNKFRKLELLDSTE